jgi:hypothetical protein
MATLNLTSHSKNVVGTIICLLKFLLNIRKLILSNWAMILSIATNNEGGYFYKFPKK